MRKQEEELFQEVGKEKNKIKSNDKSSNGFKGSYPTAHLDAKIFYIFQSSISKCQHRILTNYLKK